VRSLAWASAFLLVAGRAALLLACASVSRAQTPSPAGPAFPVNTETYSTQADPDVAIDADGDFVVVWSSRFQDGASFGVFGQRFSSTGAPAGEEFPVNTTTADFEGESAVAMDASGSFVVVWQGEDDDNAGIDGQRFDPTGAPLGVEFQVNSCFDHSQESPGIAMEPEGTFVVQLGRFRGPIEVEEAAFFVRDFDPATGAIRLSDGTSEPLDPETLRVSARDGAGLCAIKRSLAPAGLLARFTQAAWAELAAALEGPEDAPRLRLAGRSIALPASLVASLDFGA